jgi:hypothetical protein
MLQIGVHILHRLTARRVQLPDDFGNVQSRKFIANRLSDKGLTKYGLLFVLTVIDIKPQLVFS